MTKTSWTLLLIVGKSFLSRIQTYIKRNSKRNISTIIVSLVCQFIPHILSGPQGEDWLSLLTCFQNNFISHMITHRKWLPSHMVRSWWRHQNGNIFRVTGHLCGESTHTNCVMTFAIYAHEFCHTQLYVHASFVLTVINLSSLLIICSQAQHIVY